MDACLKISNMTKIITISVNINGRIFFKSYKQKEIIDKKQRQNKDIAGWIKHAIT